ncbi:hypothetical protein MUK42_34275 [Musa troglodytarum]|uniref:Uncharacterized protein n=1 Tax=Musa troglodytarum TaxID=320322 RepID=A0A9E7FSS7_9LILI|nr:hypothetical protein MUK42_34275 [Musa troglodytarum]
MAIRNKDGERAFAQVTRRRNQRRDEVKAGWREPVFRPFKCHCESRQGEELNGVAEEAQSEEEEEEEEEDAASGIQLSNNYEGKGPVCRAWKG